MDRDPEETKVSAIFAVREATEAKVRAELALEETRSPEARDALLDAQLELEHTTQAAIDMCHECDHEHPLDQPHRGASRIGTRDGNVLGVDFRPPGAP